MGKLRDRLEKQLKTELKKDAEDCIEIYNKIKEMNNGKVWESSWNPLVITKFGSYPSNLRTFKPSSAGYIFLKGVRNENLKTYTKEEVSEILLKHTSDMFEDLSLKPYPKETLMNYTKQYTETL